MTEQSNGPDKKPRNMLTAIIAIVVVIIVVASTLSKFLFS